MALGTPPLTPWQLSTVSRISTDFTNFSQFPQFLRISPISPISPISAISTNFINFPNFPKFHRISLIALPPTVGREPTASRSEILLSSSGARHRGMASSRSHHDAADRVAKAASDGFCASSFPSWSSLQRKRLSQAKK